MTGQQIVCTNCGKSGIGVFHPLCDACRAPFTLYMCGPIKCEHDYSGEGTAIERGWTAICTKCGARAIDEAAWQ